MNHDVNDLLKKLLNMPHDQRAFLADRLIDSLDAEMDQGVELAWQKEIQRRMDESKDGSVSFLSWEDAKSKLQGH